MYQALLTRRYLTSKVMPLLSMAAVLLSVATVLITWSVMGGFLEVLLGSGRKLIGDVAITWPNVGFKHADDLIDRLEDHPGIDRAAPVVETFGLIQLPDAQVREVFIKGIEPESFGAVTDLPASLWWRPIEEPTRRDTARLDPRLPENTAPDFMAWTLNNGLSMTRPDDRTGEPKPAAILGITVSGMNRRTEGGVYEPLAVIRPEASGDVAFEDVFMPRNGEIAITVLALDSGGRPIDSVTRSFPVANEFQSGIYDADSKTVLVPLEGLQKMLRMDEARRLVQRESFDPLDPASSAGELVTDPERVTTVLVRGAPGTDARAVQAIARDVYAEFAGAHPGEVPDALSVNIQTWEDLNATLIGAVKKETGLVLFVFGIVCFTTVFLVLSIFWSMVSEKTKDIGILRSLGASTAGIAWLWLRYGFAIGVVGTACGLVSGYLIVTNINAIHEWLGTTFGLVIWDARVYYFTDIPRVVEPWRALVVGIAGVMTCVVGAAIPALRAARMDPVKALRFE
ncbi:MAG: FtsX-like permease family protein [Planctomycetota bacterium]